MLAELLVRDSDDFVQKCTVFHPHMHAGRVRVRDALTAFLLDLW